MSEDAILGLDSAFGPIGVALVSMNHETLAHEFVRDAAGAQAEKLPPLVERMLGKAQLPARAILRIAVTTGPGAFTGVRVGLAFAKGMALALKVPLLGFTTLACMANQARSRLPGATSHASVVDARRGEVYVQGFDRDLKCIFGPTMLTREEARDALNRLPKPLLIADREVDISGVEDAEVVAVHAIDPEKLAFLAFDADPEAHPPVPCYLRAPDARLPT